jgi:hypothetical protein
MPHNLSSARKSPTGAVGGDADAAAVAVVVAGVVGEAAGVVAAAEAAAGPGAAAVGAKSERLLGKSVQDGSANSGTASDAAELVDRRAGTHPSSRWPRTFLSPPAPRSLGPLRASEFSAVDRATALELLAKAEKRVIDDTREIARLREIVAQLGRSGRWKSQKVKTARERLRSVELDRRVHIGDRDHLASLVKGRDAERTINLVWSDAIAKGGAPWFRLGMGRFEQI